MLVDFLHCGIDVYRALLHFFPHLNQALISDWLGNRESHCNCALIDQGNEHEGPAVPKARTDPAYVLSNLGITGETSTA